MEENETPESGSPVGNSETESPPASSGFVVSSGGAEMVPPPMNTAVNVVSTAGFGADLTGKKKRGRPRKYDSDGNLRVPIVKSPPSQFVTPPPPPGFTLSHSSDLSSSKKPRGQPRGSGNWQMLATFGEIFGETAGGDFTPHVVNVLTGEDVAGKILSISQKGPLGICILAANGVVSNVTLRQPGSSGGILTYEGRFEILSLTGSFTISENGGVKSRSGGLSVSLAGADGRIIGGGVAGSLLAASPIQIVVGSFVPNGYKTHNNKRKQEHQYDHVSPPYVVTSATPVSQASPVLNNAVQQNPTTPLAVQNHGGSDNCINVKPTPLSTSTYDWNGTDPTFHQRVYPDINASAPVE